MQTTIAKSWINLSGAQTIVIEKHDRPLVHVNMTFPTGNYADPSNKEGLVNLMAEMLLRGTKKHSRDQIEQKLDFLGANVEVNVGPQTLMMDGQVLSKNLPALLELMTEMLLEPAFLQDEMDKLKEEIISQIHLSLESDAHLAKTEFSKQIYKNHPYGKEEEGTPKSLANIKREDLLTIYGSAIRRNGMLVGSAGALSREEFDRTLDPLIKKIPEGGSPSVSQPAKLEKPQGIQVTLVDKPERSQAHFFIGHPSVTINDPDYFPLSIFMTAFAGGLFQAQYMQEIRVKRGWAYGAYGKIDGRRDGGAFYLYTYPKVSDTPDAIALSIELLEKAAHGDSVTDQVIAFAKNNIIRSYPFARDLPEKVLADAMFNKIVGRPDNYNDTYLSRIEAVTPAQARAAAHKHIDTKNLYIVVLCTAKDLKDKLAAKLQVKNIQIVPFDKLD